MMPDDRSPTNSLVPTAERTLRLIELLLSRPEGWTPQELLVELDLSRSSLFVLLRTFKALGYVEQPGKRGRYVAGPRLQAWRAPFAPSAQDMLTAFYQETAAHPAQETLVLVVRMAEHRAITAAEGCLVIAQADGDAKVRSTFVTGQVYQDLTAAANILNPNPSSTLIDHGFAIASTADSIDIALPICRDGCTPEAVLMLSAPAFRWTEDQLRVDCLDYLRNLAAHLSYRLGAPYYSPYCTNSPDSLQMTAVLNPDEIAAFLQGPWAASLACVRPDGRPHVIPVWQEWDGTAFYVIAWKGSQWADYLSQNPHVSFTVDEPWIPLRRVVVQGTAHPFQAGSVELDRLIQRMTRRYLGQVDGATLVHQVQRAFLIQPDSIRGWRGLPGRQSSKPRQA